MKKILLTATISLISLSFIACASGGSSSDGGSMLKNSGNSKYSTSSSSGESTTENRNETETERINREIREVDAAYKAGKISKEEHGQKKAALLQQLFN